MVGEKTEDTKVDDEKEELEETQDSEDEKKEEEEDNKKVSAPDSTEEVYVPEPELEDGLVPPDVKGIKYQGKTLAVSHYKGDNLVILDVQGVSYTLSGQELTDFLATL